MLNIARETLDVRFTPCKEVLSDFHVTVLLSNGRMTQWGDTVQQSDIQQYTWSTTLSECYRRHQKLTAPSWTGHPTGTHRGACSVHGQVSSTSHTEHSATKLGKK